MQRCGGIGHKIQTLLFRNDIETSLEISSIPILSLALLVVYKMIIFFLKKVLPLCKLHSVAHIASKCNFLIGLTDAHLLWSMCLAQFII